MYDRAKVINNNFKLFLSNKASVSPFFSLNFDDTKHSPIKLVDIVESQMISRLLDLKARNLKALGKSYYTIGSCGHEGLAVIGEISRLSDMAFLHYRDCALMVQRSKKQPGHTIIHDLLLSFCASSEEPISGGRHKVLGHKNLFIPPQTSTIASHLPKAVGAAFSIHKNKRLQNTGVLPEDAVIVCTFGDASLNHASAQTALNCAEWISYQNIPLPIVFICEDNGIGISVPTPNEWVRNSRQHSSYIKYFECNGLNLIDSLDVAQKAFHYARTVKKPVFLRFKTVRLLGHAGSDIESVYLSLKEIEKNEAQDPLLISAQILVQQNILNHDQILKMYLDLEHRIDRIAEDSILRPHLETVEAILKSLVPSVQIRELPPVPSTETRQAIFGNEWNQLHLKQPLAKLINWALTDLLHRFQSAVIFGEDVAKKGGVYNVTANLEKRFGKNKVFNSLLDETSILGTAIGMAHNNLLPIPEIQFLAYVHNAEDQLRGEAATLSFFSNGQYTNGMVVRIAGLGYQKGFGGHFHNDNSLTIFRDIPGIVIACPSNGQDAVLMLRTCVEQAYLYGKVCVFIEPIALYSTRDLHQKDDAQWSFEYPKELEQKIPLGEFHLDHHSDLQDKKLCLLTYGNGYFLSQQAKKILQEKYSINTSIIDLRWIAPIDEKKLSSVLSEFSHVLIVEECRKTGSMSEYLMTLMMEHCSPLPKTQRLCSYDSFIPLADAANIVLIQVPDIVRSSMELLGVQDV